MRLNYKKSLKLATLLITAIIIGTASAVTYSYMYIKGSVTISSAELIWLKGSDVPNCNITGSTVSLAVNVEQGTPINFTNALFLKNANATGYFNYTISVAEPLSPTDFETAKMYIYQNYTTPGTWKYLAMLDLTSASSEYSGSLFAGNYLRITLGFNATASTGTKDFQIQVQYGKY